MAVVAYCFPIAVLVIFALLVFWLHNAISTVGILHAIIIVKAFPLAFAFNINTFSLNAFSVPHFFYTICIKVTLAISKPWNIHTLFIYAFCVGKLAVFIIIALIITWRIHQYARFILALIVLAIGIIKAIVEAFAFNDRARPFNTS